MEVNNRPVHSADELQQAIQAAKENLSLKVHPGISSDVNNKPMKSTVSNYFIILIKILFNIFKKFLNNYLLI